MDHSPPTHSTGVASALLTRAEAGDPAASDELFVIVYDELRRMAAGLIARERPGLTLQPTALVHEAYLRLLGGNEVAWNGRGHFFGAAAQAMRRILVDRARRARAKRSDADPAQVADPAPESDGLSIDILALNEALGRLERVEELQGRIVVLRYFAGLTNEQTAEALGLSPATIKKEWVYARAWLKREMEHGHP
jgi:RNA polymerase sigma factor (TIGR02999 family)